MSGDGEMVMVIVSDGENSDGDSNGNLTDVIL